MPSFDWLGLNVDGKVISGNLYCTSIQALDQKLKLDKINLISAKEKKSALTIFNRITLKDRLDFFMQLHQLLDSGVMLPKALAILEKSNKKMQPIIAEINFQVQEGSSFAKSLQIFPKIFGSLEIQLSFAGQETGNLCKALKYIAELLQMKQQFKSKLKSILLLPSITVAFFIVISLIIFFYVIPSFTTIFQENKIQQNGLIFKLSAFFISVGLYKLIMIVAVLIISVYLFFKTTLGKSIKSFLAIKLPFFKTVTLSINLTYFLQSIAFMLQSGVHLSKALVIAQQATSNLCLRQKLVRLNELVEKGKSLEEAMQEIKIFSTEVLTLVSIGQESGRLGLMLQKASDFYLEKSIKLLSSFLNIFQPILMIILGCLVMSLIASVYLPILDLASGIQI